jgi:putative oxidoreductase
MKYIVLIGRILFSLIFINSGLSHFESFATDYAAAQGVPMASVLVPISGLMAIIGGLSIALGYKAKLGAWLLIIFLVPVTLMMHAFWKVTDPEQQQFQIAMFMKNLSMLGGALLITWFGAGPASIDARKPVGTASTEDHGRN